MNENKTGEIKVEKVNADEKHYCAMTKKELLRI